MDFVLHSAMKQTAWELEDRLDSAATVTPQYHGWKTDSELASQRHDSHPSVAKYIANVESFTSNLPLKNDSRQGA